MTSLALPKMFGSECKDLFSSVNRGQGREHAKRFARKVREKMRIATDPTNGGRAVLLIGNHEWSFSSPDRRKRTTVVFRLHENLMLRCSHGAFGETKQLMGVLHRGEYAIMQVNDVAIRNDVGLT